VLGRSHSPGRGDMKTTIRWADAELIGLTQSSYAYDEDGLRSSKTLDSALTRG